MFDAKEVHFSKNQSYSKSVLGILFGDLLTRLKNIEKTLPDHKNLIDNDRASVYIKLIHALVSIAHNNLFPLFDKGRVPTSVNIVALGTKLLFKYKRFIEPLINKSLTPEEMFFIKLIQFVLKKLTLLADKRGMLAFETIETTLKEEKGALFSFENIITNPKTMLTPDKRDALFNGALQQVQALQKTDDDIDITLLVMHLILERVPKHPAFYALLEDLTLLLGDLPEEFNQLVLFLTPKCFPKLLLDTALIKDSDIENVQILSEERYRYKIIYKKTAEDDTNSDLEEDDIVDLSESYFVIRNIISFVLSACRRYYLLDLVGKDSGCERRVTLFQQIERQAVEKNNLLQQQAMEKQCEMEQSLEAIVASLPAADLPATIETIKTYLTVCAQLSAYIQKHEDNTLKQFPPILLMGNVTELKPLPLLTIFSSLIEAARQNKQKLFEMINKIYDMNDFIPFTLNKMDRLERIQAKIDHNDKKLQALILLSVRAREDAEMIGAHLRTLNLSTVEIQRLYNEYLKAFDFACYEKKKSHFISDLEELHLQREKYLFFKSLGLDASQIKSELEAIERHIDQYRGVSAGAESVFLRAKRGVNIRIGTVLNSSRTASKKAPVVTKKTEETSSDMGAENYSGVSRRIAPGFKRGLSRISSDFSFSRLSASKKPFVVQTAGENERDIAAEKPPEEKSTDLMFQTLRAQHQALSPLYHLSLAFEKLKQEFKIIVPDVFPATISLDLIHQAHMELLNAFKAIDSPKHHQRLVSLRQQYQSLIDSAQPSAALDLLKQQYKSLIDANKYDEILKCFKQQHQVSMEKLMLVIREQLMAQYTLIDQQHSQILMEYSELRAEMSQKKVDIFSKRIEIIRDKIQRFEKENAVFCTYIDPYLAHPLLAEALKANFPRLTLPFSAETLQAMKPRQQMIAHRLQLLIDSTSSSNRYLLSQLQTQLCHYIETGNNLEGILQWMEEKQPAARHVRFKTVWHQMHVDFWDEKYNARGYAVHDLDIKIQQLQESNALYAPSINALYQMMQDIREIPHPDSDEVETIAVFIDACMQDLAMFIDGKIQFEDFQKKFLTRLHSQDELMQQKNTREMWRYWVANIVIGLLTAGIFLAAQWTYTRVSQGRGTLFFDITQKEQLIQNMEKHLQHVMKP